MPPRFHAPQLTPAATQLTLTADESRHLVRVLRLRAGDAVEVFDGRGRMVAGTVTAPVADATVISVGHDVPAQPEPPLPLVLCPALLKGDAMDAVIRDATVLGAVAIVPLRTARTNVPASRTEGGRLSARWTRVAVAAAKQCGRAVLPALREVRDVADLIADDAFAGWDRRWLVEPTIAASASPMSPSRSDARRGIVLAIGPEGGWTPGEVEQAMAARWMPWSLGPFTLRAEQMALAALAVVRSDWAGTAVPAAAAPRSAAGDR